MKLNPAQIKNLDEYQRAGIVHEFTCCGQAMRATAEGLRCDKCNWLQTNLIPGMIDGTILANQREMFKGLGLSI